MPPTILDPYSEHDATLTLASKRVAAVLFLKLLVIVALPSSTLTPPPLERAIYLDPASL
jgi:hypothetical protein